MGTAHWQTGDLSIRSFNWRQKCARPAC